MMVKKIFEPALDSDNNWYPGGTHFGNGYHGGYGYPQTRCVDIDDAERICEFMNAAHAIGVEDQQLATKRVLGL